MKKNLGAKLSDKITKFVGSWRFIVIQSVILTIWVIINFNNLVLFDPYPFILLNLFLSFQAAFATPMILMSGNRQGEQDRKNFKKDLDLDIETNQLIKDLIKEIKELKK